MSVKRIRDPAGLRPDYVTANMADSPTEWSAIIEIMDAGSDAARIESLRRHESLWPIADALASRARDAKPAAAMRLLLAIEQAENKALYLDTVPQVIRDNARQEGTRKERRPEVTEWIAGQLRRDPQAKTPDLWSRAPDWLTEQVGLSRFGKRVTAERKKSRK